MTISEELIARKEALMTRIWVQGVPEEKDQSCLVYDAVLVPAKEDGDGTGCYYDEYYDDKLMLSPEALEFLDELTGGAMDWNDANGRTLAEVMVLLDNVIVAAKEIETQIE